MSNEDLNVQLVCSFCGRMQSEAALLINGIGVDAGAKTHSACICDSCIELCMTILANRDRERFERLVDSARHEKI